MQIFVKKECGPQSKEQDYTYHIILQTSILFD